jgi:hypothetical protein
MEYGIAVSTGVAIQADDPLLHHSPAGDAGKLLMLVL